MTPNESSVKIFIKTIATIIPGISMISLNIFMFLIQLFQITDKSFIKPTFYPQFIKFTFHLDKYFRQ